MDSLRLLLYCRSVRAPSFQYRSQFIWPSSNRATHFLAIVPSICHLEQPPLPLLRKMIRNNLFAVCFYSVCRFTFDSIKWENWVEKHESIELNFSFAFFAFESRELVISCVCVCYFKEVENQIYAYIYFGYTPLGQLMANNSKKLKSIKQYGRNHVMTRTHTSIFICMEIDVVNANER